ncbi:MAG: EVE domain-containing protein [marine benthic group bacterium]|nr:EVE domain-containing protein [Candidatus Benthicola marisminoris]
MGRCWLMKSEPDVYSIADLERDGSTCWEGVRNYQARNLMREMEIGDRVLFYHSNAKPPGVVGLARVCRLAYPDHFSWEEGHKYFDPKSTPDSPRWWMVDVEYVDTLPRMVALNELKEEPGLENMVVTRRSRLSVQPVTDDEYEIVVRMGGGRS